MKTYKLFLLVLGSFLVTSCSSIRVATDYDSSATFDTYNTFTFHKPSIDKVEISDLDKRRILKAIETELIAKGMQPSETPDVYVSIFTRDYQRVDVWNNNFGWGWGWGWGWDPWMWGGRTSVTTETQGVLYIDIIDAHKKQLVWQGEGNGVLTQNNAKKEQRIKEFVSKILEQYPPKKK
jgi:hypothetical protein